MRDKVVSSWNSVMGGLAFHGHTKESVNLFKEMRRLKFRPNEIMLLEFWLLACSHAGKVEEGRRYFNLMKNVYRIVPNIKHCGCMVDLLGRAGLLNEAFEFIEKMEIAPNAIVWRNLLGACGVYGNLELGRRENKRLLEMRRDESGISCYYLTYMLREVKKEPGNSLIEADNSALMHFFVRLQT